MWQRREQEQNEFQQQFFRGRHANDQRQNPEYFNFDQFYHQDNGQERQQQFILEEFL